jgi:hypothetical protein
MAGGGEGRRSGGKEEGREREERREGSGREERSHRVKARKRESERKVLQTGVKSIQVLHHTPLTPSVSPGRDRDASDRLSV